VKNILRPNALVDGHHNIRQDDDVLVVEEVVGYENRDRPDHQSRPDHQVCRLDLRNRHLGHH
jgi:hypothetical protein